MRGSMKTHEAAFIERFSLLMSRAVQEDVLTANGVRKFVNSMPVGHRRVLGYRTKILSEVLVSLREGNPQTAELQAFQGLAAVETFCLEEKWDAAWRLIHLPEPPWTAWAQVDLRNARRELTMSRLTDPTWASIYIQELKDVEFMSRRRSGGKGKDGRKGEKKEEEGG